MEARVGSPVRRNGSISRTEYPDGVGRNDRSWSPGHNNGLGDSYERRSSQTLGSRSEGGKSFLGNSTKVTGVQDIISRMRAADHGNPQSRPIVSDILNEKNQPFNGVSFLLIEDYDDGSADDVEARTLLNKFLGASAMMTGMEPLVKASGGNSSTLVSQVERQRILGSPTRTGSRVSFMIN